MLVHGQAQDVTLRIPFALDVVLVSGLSMTVFEQWIRMFVHDGHHVELYDRAFHSSEEGR